jgi:hypothetical protein
MEAHRLEEIIVYLPGFTVWRGGSH